MRALAALLMVLCICTGAHAETKEPFGAQFHTRSDTWAFSLQVKFQTDERYRKILSDIARQVEQKPKAEWLTWINQLVNTSVEMTGPLSGPVCARKAVAKDEVMRLLGLPKGDRRLVYGTTPKDPHAVLAVRSPEGWLILDSVPATAGYRPALESQIRDFKAVRSFN